MRALTNELVTVLICSLPVVLLIFSAVYRRMKNSWVTRIENKNKNSIVKKSTGIAPEEDRENRQKGNHWKAALETT